GAHGFTFGRGLASAPRDSLAHSDRLSARGRCVYDRFDMRFTGGTYLRLTHVLIVAAAVSTTSTPALGSFSASQIARLERGEGVVEVTEYKQASREYVGGVAYLIVAAPAEHLSELLRDVARTADLLP